MVAPPPAASAHQQTMDTIWNAPALDGTIASSTVEEFRVEHTTHFFHDLLRNPLEITARIAV
jgi:hypothetical protein